jgi:4-hydroxy-tetrahydrodipicolinate reductase
VTVARVAIIGATGRMGRALLAALPEFSSLRLAAAVTIPAHESLGRDAGEAADLRSAGVLLTSDLATALSGGIDVAIDFSSVTSTAATLVACRSARVPLLIGTTGLGPDLDAAIGDAGREIPVLAAANTSLALNVLLELVRRASRALPASFDIDIIEAHHRHKVDAPSGTALALGRAIAEGRGQPLPAEPVLTGSQPGPRPEGPIGFAVVRGGDVVGEHEVRFLGGGEQLRLTHLATDRAIFARGALAAAAWLAGQPPARYGMADFLFKDQ